MIKQIYLYLLLSFFLLASRLSAQAGDKLSGHLTISGAFALYPMVVTWADEFEKLHPNVHIDISAGGTGKGITDVLSGMADIAMVSREVNSQEYQKGAFSVTVTRDAVVPTISTANPELKSILSHGVRKDDLKAIWIQGKITYWGQVLGNKSHLPLRAYTRSDACGAGESWGKYLGVKQEDLQGIGVFSDPGITQAVIRDPCALGYNNICYVYDLDTKRPYPGVCVLPLDLNNNGKIDTQENFFKTLDDLYAAIALGKYPSRDLFFLTKGKPGPNLTGIFIIWILSDGQQFVTHSGFIRLDKKKQDDELNRIKG